MPFDSQELGVVEVLQRTITAVVVANELSLSNYPHDQGRSVKSALDVYDQDSSITELECLLNDANMWSLFKHAKLDQVDEEDEQRALDELERLRHSTVLQTKKNRIETLICREKEKSARRKDGNLRLPSTLQLDGIKEDALESRWDAKGQPLPLGRNVFEEHYAPRSYPLKFLHSRPPAEIFSHMQHLVKQSIVDREKNRIARLNRMKRDAEKDALAALEAKFDRLFDGKDSILELPQAPDPLLELHRSNQV